LQRYGFSSKQKRICKETFVIYSTLSLFFINSFITIKEKLNCFYEKARQLFGKSSRAFLKKLASF
jgi:hypothetical protein